MHMSSSYRWTVLGLSFCVLLCFTTASLFVIGLVTPPDIPVVVSRLMFYNGFFLLFCHLSSEHAEQNSTEIGHMLGSECDLKMHVQNLGYHIPLLIGGPKPPFLTTSQLNDNFNSLYLWSETWHTQSGKCVDNYMGSSTSCQNVRNFGPQTASNWTAIFTYPT